MLTGVLPQIESILAAGNQAPSGENAQPWRFVVKGSHVEVHLVPERDTSYYNTGALASFMAIGAVIENIVIAASALGFKCTVELFPPGAEATHVASIELINDPSIPKDPLEPQIFLRATNRKRFMTVKLSDAEKKTLADSVNNSNIAVHFADDRNDLKRLAQVGATNEEIMLSNKELHAFFFSHVNWTKEEDDAKKVGFYLKTLELSAPAAASFYILRYWGAMQQLVQFNFHKFISRQNASTYAASSAMGAISITGNDPRDFVEAGRGMERLWLTATQLGMNIQPLAGIFFFKLKIDRGEGQVFSAEQRARIEEEYREAMKIYGSVGRRLIFMFRIGSGAVPSARSSRFPLDKIVSVLS